MTITVSRLCLQRRAEISPKRIYSAGKGEFHVVLTVSNKTRLQQMKNQSIQLFIHENGGNIFTCLSSINECATNMFLHLYCLFRDAGREDELREKCKKMLNEGKITSFSLINGSPETTFEKVANQLFSLPDFDQKQNNLLFFLSSTIHLAPNTITNLAENLVKNQGVAGLNPLLLGGWNARVKNRVAHLGIVCDCQQYLHYLHEGLPATNPLATKKRFFQIAHPGAVILRQADFIKLEGFNTKIEYLAWYDFCVRLTGENYRFSTETSCHAFQTNEFDSWEFCGIWNSALQRGRLRASGLKTDYPFKAREDKLDYNLDAWLCEGVKNLPLEVEKDSPEGKWLEWRHAQNPLNLIKYITSLPAEKKVTAFDLSTALPASLPCTFNYYISQCEKIEQFAKKSGLIDLENQAKDWRKKSKRFHYSLLRPGMQLLQKAGAYNCSLDWSTCVYKAWVEVGEKIPDIHPGKDWPMISVLMPVWNPKPEFLLQAINSVRAQKYSNWQLCIADDASTNPEVTEILRSFATSDKRVSIVFREENGHICKASNSALELARAPYTAFLDHDDMLTPEALGIVAEAIAKKPSLQFIYSDEDHIDANNVRMSPIFKPEFDRDLLYTGHLSIFGTQILQKTGGLRPGFEGSQDFDLSLRFAELLHASQIAHLSHILYHWRIHEESTSSNLAAKPYVLEATKKAKMDAANRMGINAEIAETGINNFYIMLRKVPNNLSCSIIFLTDSENPSPNANLVASIEALAEKINLEICIQPISSSVPNAALPGNIPHRVLAHGNNSWTRACNNAALQAKSPILLFLYAGLRPLPNCRPEQLIIEATRDDLAMVGGLIWRNGYLVNGGWYPDITGLPFRLLRDLPYSRLAESVWGQFLLPRHTIGISWQCMAIRKEIIENDKFLDESLGILSMVDFSLRHAEKHLHTLATPWGQWEGGKKEFATEEAQTKIRELWGENIRSNGLRNANLRAAPDNDWTLIFNEK